MSFGGERLAAPTGLALRRTALYGLHKALGAKMVEFGGWEMPVEYSGIVQEHLAVRRAAGLFDVSHMGEIEVSGPRALSLLQHITCNDASRLRDFQAQYSALMHPRGSAVDDCVVHRLAEDHYFICVNAANTDRDFDWMIQHNPVGAELRNASGEYSQLALQGPRASEIISKVTSTAIAGVKYYSFCLTRCCGVEGILARTGYTGEDGFEFYFPPGDSEKVWNTLIKPASPKDWFQPAWAPGTHCDSRPATPFTATSSTKKLLCSKPIWDGLPSLKKASSLAGMLSSSNEPKVHARSWWVSK